MIHVIPSCENNELVGGKEPVPSDGREQGSTWDSVKVRNGVHGLKGEGKMGGGASTHNQLFHSVLQRLEKLSKLHVATANFQEVKARKVLL